MRPVFKFLEIDNYQAISDDIYNYVVNHTELLKFQSYCFFNHLSPSHIIQHVPSLKKFLDNNCLKPTLTAIVLVPPLPTERGKDSLHVDELDPYVRILWPIKNCPGCITKLFDIPRESLKESFLDGAENTFNPNHATSYFFPIEQRDWPLINEFELLQPVLIDVSVAHAVYPAPGATEYRISFAMGFDKDLPISKSIDAWPELNFNQ